MTTGKSNSARNCGLYKTVAIAIFCAIGLRSSPVQSFRCLPTVSGSRCCNRSISSIHIPLGDKKTFPTSPETVPSAPTNLSLSPNKNDDTNDQGGEKLEKMQKQRGIERLLDEKNRPGLVFTTVLTLWHFWIGPALRPIILDMQQ